MRNSNKNIFYLRAYKKQLLLLLFFIPVIGSAQQDNDSISRHVIDEVAPPPSVELFDSLDYIEEDTDSDYKKTDKKYFLNLWEFEDSFTVSQRKVPTTAVKKMQEDDNFWYANGEIKNKEPEKKKAKEPAYVPIGKQPWFQVLLWVVIIGCFIVILVLYLAANKVGLFGKKPAASNNADTDEIPEDIFAINYQKEIDKAAGGSNYRLAIRLMFLRLLKQLAERDIIQYKHDRTNFDYLMQLRSTSYYENFFRITRDYEYSWYGKFPLTEESYTAIRNDFSKLDRQLY